ncbi:hypothetical protein UK12_05140 [Saccharothrix sp. ST-888]|nr:hypothetical protein UK12_05140 [Saccharothrix sp. ST-888]
MLHEAGRVAEGLGVPVLNGLRGEVDSGGPLVVLLDDLHGAGAEDARALNALRGQVADTPTVWCVTRRRGSANGPVDNALLSMTIHHERVALSRLGEPEAHALAADLLGAEPDAALARVLAEAGGHPEALKALVEGVREEGCLTFGPTARLTSYATPERVRVLVQRLLHECSAFCRRMLRVAAVLDRRIAFDELARLLGTTPANLLPAFDEAVIAGLVRGDTGDLAFANELFWRTTCESMPPTVRTALRRQAAALRAQHFRAQGPAEAGRGGLGSDQPAEGRAGRAPGWAGVDKSMALPDGPALPWCPSGRAHRWPCPGLLTVSAVE